MEEYRDCLGCSNSFSEPYEDGEDKLYCLLLKKYVKEDDVCEEFN